jgi:hypothetical protein
MAKRFVIKNKKEGFWSNKLGWVEFKKNASRFTEKETKAFVFIPQGGEWMPLKTERKIS